ncbi:hypothetical protein [Synechocystis salina]|uniref:hypothetical protein n=1 Tax=Synechocystis salina TaxID=945780 RepID=UPI001D140501|nr:hypothetical protein [Synechocystis salina]
MESPIQAQPPLDFLAPNLQPWLLRLGPLILPWWIRSQRRSPKLRPKFRNFSPGLH